MLNVILLQICKKICEICVICGFLCIFALDMLQPLAERLRPRTLDDYIGQEHLVGEGAVLRKMKSPIWALSSAGSERLPYKQRVGGSNPSAPTDMMGRLLSSTE